MKVNEIITEAANPAQQAAIAISMKKAGKKPRSQVNELAPSPGGAGPSDYFRVLASAWYNHDISQLADIARKGGSPMKKIIDAQEAVEKMLQRGVIGSDGKTRKYDITYNSDFDGVVIQSADYYEYSDYDAAGNEVDSRNGRPWGPNDYMEFDGNDLDEGIYESTELVEEFDLIESIIERLAAHNGVDAEVIWEDLETLTEDELYAFAVTSEPIMESQGVTEAFGLYGPFTVTINTGERPQSRTKTKKFRREDDAILYAEDWLEDAPQYVFATAKVTDPEGNVVWTTDEQGVAEDSEESYIIVRTDSEGKKDVFAGNFDTYERAQKELDDCLAHPLHTKYKQKFEIKRKGQEGVAEGLNQGIPSVLYHATYRPRLKSIKLKGLGAGGKRNWEDSKSGAIYLALDPNVAESYAESSDMVPDEWLDQIVILKISTAGLDSSKFSIDSNVQDNAGDTVEYHGVIPVSNISLYEQGVAEDWQKANKRDRTAGMSQKAVNAYRRENPGSKLKTAVTTKPSKLKRGSKASKRRKSYCSRSRGQMKMHSISCAKTPDKAICKARRRWNC